MAKWAVEPFGARAVPRIGLGADFRVIIGGFERAELTFSQAYSALESCAGICSYCAETVQLDRSASFFHLGLPLRFGRWVKRYLSFGKDFN